MFEQLRQKYPWPGKRPLSAADAFDLSLDGGGRELMTTLFEQKQPKLMLEVGTFLGGSALRWLRENPDMKLVCVDPLRDTTHTYLRSLVDVPWAQKFGKDNLLKYADLVASHGMLAVVQNNLWEHRNRVVIVRKRLQDAAPDLRGLSPDLTFIDAMKEREEFTIIDRLFPDAVFAGDDWNWQDEHGNLPIHTYASEIATRRGGEVYGKACTFVINEPRLGLSFSPYFRHQPAARPQQVWILWAEDFGNREIHKLFASKELAEAALPPKPWNVDGVERWNYIVQGPMTVVDS